MDKYLNRLTRRVESSLVEGFEKRQDRLKEACYYALSVKGKRLRPLLFLTLLEALEKDPRDFLDIAAAIEYIHTYSLIHDDLPAMDDDDVRRGKPTVHVQFDEPIALLAGDTLLTMAFERIARSDLAPETVVDILKILTGCIGLEGMACGQALDIDFDGDPGKIIDIQRKKTAYLISGCLRCAGRIAGLDESRMFRLQEAGLSIGVAFQMADDLLDIIGDEREVGKRLKKDGDNKSPNSVLYFGEERVKKEIHRYYQSTVTLLAEMNISFPPFLFLINKMAYRNK